MKPINHIGYLAKMIHNAVDRKLNNEFGIYDLSSTQAGILRYLHHNKGKIIYQKDLEVVFKCSHPTITGILQRMEGKGYIQCLCDETDRRKKIISITDTGIAIHNHIKSEIVKTEKQLVEGLSEEEQELLKKLLNHVLHNIDSGFDTSPHCK